MNTIIFWLIAGVFLLSGLGIIYLKRVPHGWVQFRSGLVLKFLPALDSKPVVELRDSLEVFVKKQHPKIFKTLPIEDVKDVSIPTRHGEIPARVYNTNQSKPTHNIIYIHGGGWCVGSINTFEEVCRRLAIKTGQPVISLDYSLAPEFKFPHAHEECLDGVSWIAQQEDFFGLKQLPLVLIGDSAGGNLVITSTYDCPPEIRSKIDKIAPVYPAVDSLKSDYFSSKNYGEGYYLTNKSMTQFTEGLINQEEDLNDLRLSPIRHAPIGDFPEMMVITAYYDPLRDQGEAFASKMKSEGNKVLLKRYDETIHAFFGLKDFGNQGLRAISDINKFIKGQSIADLRSI